MSTYIHHPRQLAADDSSLPLNTPWSSSPPSSAASSVSRRNRGRRSSLHDDRPIVIQTPPTRRTTTTTTSSRTIVMPASSLPASLHHNSRYPAGHPARYYEAATAVTRFKPDAVSRRAVELRSLPYTLEPDGAITVLRALDQPAVDDLVALTREIRREFSPVCPPSPSGRPMADLKGRH